MSLPTPQKTWLTAAVANVMTGSDVGNQKDLEIKKKNQRKAWGQTVVGSSNGTTGARDGVDRWVTTADIPNFVTAPWIEFANGNGSHDLLVYANGGESDWYFYHSPSGAFTGGSASARPTAADEELVYGNSWFGRGGGGSTPQFVCNMWLATDGSCIRFTYWQGGINFGNIFYDAVDDPTPGWTHPNYAMIDKHGVDAFAEQDCGQVGNIVFSPYAGDGVFRTWGPHGRMTMLGTCEASGYGGVYSLTQTLGNTKNQISNTYRNLPRCGLFNAYGVNGFGATAGDFGWHGRVFDFWWIGQRSRPPGGGDTFHAGDTTPLDGSKQFVIIGDFMLPWNGGAFRIS